MKYQLLLIYLLTLSAFSQKKIYYDEIYDFNNGYAVVKKGDITTFIDTSGVELKIDDIKLDEYLTPYDDFTNIYGMQKNGYYVSYKKDELGIRNLKGEFIVEPKYSDIKVLNNYFILKDDTDLQNVFYEVLNSKCESIYKIHERYSNKKKTPIVPLSDNVIAVSKPKSSSYKLIFIDSKKETDYTYRDFRKQINGLIKLKKYTKTDGKYKWGFINENGEEIIDFIYTNPPGDFCNDLAVVKNLDKKYGYINRNNNLVIEPKFIEAYGFINDKALVRIYEKKVESGIINLGYRIIDTKGKILYNLKNLRPNNLTMKYYKKTVIDQNNLIRLKDMRANYFVLDLETFELKKTNYKQINRFDTGLSLIKYYSQYKPVYGYINKKGELKLVNSKREF